MELRSVSESPRAGRGDPSAAAAHASAIFKSHYGVRQDLFNYATTSRMIDRSGNHLRCYSARNASNGEIELARRAGTKDATSADTPSARTAVSITTGL
jgi:hypothetical protein